MPRVAALLQRLACHITLPLEDPVSFRDPMDRRVDMDLKRLYSVAGADLKTCVLELDGNSGEELRSASSSP